MDFEWDPKKAATDRAKHDVDFADVTGVFYDPRAVTLADDYPDEERYATIGIDNLGRIIVVVYCWRDKSIRIISARKATRVEREIYEEGQ
ncbi:MAG: BrnT family toxin [Gemmatimonadota bacterium]